MKSMVCKTSWAVKWIVVMGVLIWFSKILGVLLWKWRVRDEKFKLRGLCVCGFLFLFFIYQERNSYLGHLNFHFSNLQRICATTIYVCICWLCNDTTKKKTWKFICCAWFVWSELPVKIGLFLCLPAYFSKSHVFRFSSDALDTSILVATSIINSIYWKMILLELFFCRKIIRIPFSHLKKKPKGWMITPVIL